VASSEALARNEPAASSCCHCRDGVNDISEGLLSGVATGLVPWRSV